MTLTKESYVDNVEVTGKYNVQVRRIDVIKEDGVQLSSSANRYVIQPFMDWSGEDARVKSICDAYFDADIIAEWEALQDPDGPPISPDNDYRSPGTLLADDDLDNH